MIKRGIILSAIAVGFLLCVGGTAKAGHTLQADTLQRELILQRDYVTEGKQAEKSLFNPLDRSATPRSLTPIEFARHSYAVAMNVQPRLFAPLESPLSPVAVKQTGAARLIGGYPGYAGGNLGLLFKSGEQGSVRLTAHHLSQFLKGKQGALPFTPQNRSRDTEVDITYTHVLSDRLLHVGAGFFHHQNSFYGQFIQPAYQSELDPVDGVTYPFYTLLGGGVRAELTPAPISFRSPWQYSAYAELAYARKEDPASFEGLDSFVRLPNVNADNAKPSVHPELLLQVGGQVACLFAGTDWSFGTNAHVTLHDIYRLPSEEPKAPSLLLSVDPYFAYLTPEFQARVGAKVQLFNHRVRNLAVVPDVYVKWQASDDFSLLLQADGGTELFTFKDIYKQNRYALSSAAVRGYNHVAYRIMAGVQMGQFNGFSLDLRGGYSRYQELADWSIISAGDTSTPLYPNRVDQAVHTALYQLEQKGEVGNGFFLATARYVSPVGFELTAHAKYNNYQIATSSPFSGKKVAGLPAVELSLQGKYTWRDLLTFHLGFEGMGGILFYDPFSGEELKMGFIPELDARVSYQITKHVGISLLGRNLLNSRGERWAYYHRPGAGVVGALHVTF